MPGKVINIGQTHAQVRHLHAKRNLQYFYTNYIKDSNIPMKTTGQIHHENLINKIKLAQRDAGEKAVIDNLKKLGLYTPKEEE